MKFPEIHSSWFKYLNTEFEKDYMKNLQSFLNSEMKSGKTIYPRVGDIFNALNYTPLNKVKVVIIGQDPYHGPDQAHGLSFSVQPGVKTPPSLVNIYKEIKQDLGKEIPSDGYLERWAKQGVLLLNNVLTVEAHLAASHQKKGWEQFTDVVVDLVNSKKENVVFLLWGSHAQKKGANIDSEKHLILKSPHPSPLSAHRGFFGCRHFSKTNKYLESNQIDQISW